MRCVPCRATSRTTRVVTPSTTFVRCRAVTRSSCFLPSRIPLYTSVVPGTSGKYGLSIVGDRLLGVEVEDGTGDDPRGTREVDADDDTASSAPAADATVTSATTTAARVKVASDTTP